MKELQIVESREVLGKEFNIYGDFENPLFLAKDVASWIDYDMSSVNKMINNVENDEKLIGTIFREGQQREMWFLTEDGLYEVLMVSRKPIAKKFKKEVKQVIKTLRKTGGYISNSDMMVNTYFGSLSQDHQMMIKGLFSNIEEQQKQLNERNKYIEETKPMVTFAEKCMATNQSILVRQLAKVAYDEGFKIGEKKLYKKLRDWGLIIKGGTEPTQYGMNRNLFEVEQRVVNTAYKEIITRTTKVLPKGQVYIIERLMKEKEEMAQ
ncbi:phage antirepressor Ant [Bacillus sp. CH30_1T]|uniref:phage antirepressor n=1 Tax=Bacillus sp. CH30_1T TaxID=2604836 RepID=UPI0011EDA3D3|nr:phage antirepressor KilAC domain-containing protein [Bacillus sp. CH30_1T]KAA0565319.1 phage antirepressor Ant [Bacillus sp. CH30_1T]